MSLRGHPVEEEALLPDGRVVRVRVAIANDSYIAASQLNTVVLELIGEGEHLGAVTTVLDAADESEAQTLVRQVVSGLESGELEPTAGAVEGLADTLR